MEGRSKTNILDLPDEILFEIMKLAGCCAENPDIRNVCKRFLAVYTTFTTCELPFFSTQFEDDVCNTVLLDALQYHFDLDTKKLEDSTLKKIINRFSVYAKSLRFMTLDLIPFKLADVATIMNVSVNVYDVHFSEIKINGVPEELSTNATIIRMPRLKKLYLDHCCDAESTNGLLSCVSANLLEEFNIEGQSDNAIDFTQFFKNNQTINSISLVILFGEGPNLKALEHLQFSKLQIYLVGESDSTVIRDVIGHQPKLKYLNLLKGSNEVPFDYKLEEDEDAKGIVDTDLFTAICGLKDLETLKIAFGQVVTPDTIAKIASLSNLKRIIFKCSGCEGDESYSYDNIICKMRSDVHFQKCFQKLIATPLPNLESFTWSLASYPWQDQYVMSDDKEWMKNVSQREYYSLGRIDIKTMKYPLLKKLRIEMRLHNDKINVRDILQQFPHLETLHLKTDLTFEGEPVSMHHEHIKYVNVEVIGKNDLIVMLGLMPNLETLTVRYTLFPLDKLFLPSLQYAIPQLKELELRFHSAKYQDFVIENVVILQKIVKKCHNAKIKLTGSCDFDSLAAKMDRSVGVLVRSEPSDFGPCEYSDFDKHMILWK